MKTARCLLVRVLILWCACGALTAAGAGPRPNILFIMTDDHAAHALSAYGSRINETPQMDRIARDGVKFMNCFVVNSICTPSRASILTGKYSHQNGVTVFNRFDGSQPHIGRYLQQAGYQTALIGKWHLFSDPTGFDYWNILPGQGKYHDPDMIEMGRNHLVKGYATDIITDLSIDWLRRRDPSRPFFLCTHHKAPHREWTPDAKHARLYEGRDLPEPVTFDDDYRTRSAAATEATMRIDRDLTKTDVKADPPAGLDAAALKRWHYQRYIKDYLRCVASVDDNVGRLLDFLDQSGLGTNTLVIYTSDQGFFLGDHGWYDKRFMYEESLRMPLLMRWPAVIGPGTTNAGMVLNVDFAPTFMELAGLPVPADMQGRSLRPLLEGRVPDDWRKSMYYRYYHYPADHRVQPHYGVRTERHKLIHFNKIDAWELFDLQQDPRETNNVHGKPAYAATLRGLEQELARLRRELNDTNQWADRPPTATPFREVPVQLVLHYDFAGDAEEVVSDRSGAGRHGRLAGGRRVDGPGGRAVQFGGAGQITLTVPRQAPEPAGKPFTVGAWIRADASNGVIVAQGGTTHGYSLFLRNGFPTFALRAGGDLFTVRASAPVAPGRWVHVAGTLRDTTDLAIRVDAGEPAVSRGAPIEDQPADGFSIGADTGSAVGGYTGSLPWHGAIADLRVYWGEPGAAERAAWAAR